MEVCVLAREAWRWTTQVLVVVGLGYTGGSMAFWLYGGSKQLQEERVVTTLRGAFFEAMPAARQRADEDGALTHVGALADMMRARILTEIHRDALYVSEGYVAGYGEAEGVARRPRTKVEVIGAWRGLAREAPQGGGRLVGVLPWRTSDISCHIDRGTRCHGCGLSVGAFCHSCVRVEPKRDIR